MKKLKILTVLGVLMAMGIVACNKGGEEEKPAESGQPSQSQSAGDSSDSGGSQAHTHSWDAGTVTTEAGCETEGVKTFHCSGCQETKTEAIPAKGHTWGELTDVAASDGGVDYKKAACSVQGCDAVKYEVALIKAQKADGKNPSAVSGLDGFVKLGSNGDSITLKFNSDAYGKGKLLIRGSMDYWHDDNNHNENRTLFSGKTNGSTDDNKESPNLEIKVNDKVLTVTNKKTMDELLPQIDDAHPAAKSGNSPVGDIQYGDDLVVGKGLNEIVYTRKDSYNLAVSHLIFVFHPETHADHTMSDWAVGKAATCTEDGFEVRQCSVCGIKETRVIKAAHKWGAATQVAADADKGYMAYNKYECSVCHKVKYEFAAKEAKDAVTNNKTSNPATPDPYIKLKSNGKTFSIKFNAEKLLDGELYQEGIFDGWPTNGKKFGYFSYTSSADSAKDGNFQISVNGSAIDLSQYKGGGNDSATFNFFGWSGDEEAQTFEASGDTKWSKDMVCPVGHVSIEKGEAEIVYKRLESYNLAVKNIILIVDEYNHEHTKAATLSSDDVGHWYACSDANCPLKGIKLEYAKHTLVADEAKTDEDSTCAKEGKHYVKCSVCEKELVQVIEKKAHTWVADESKTDVEATCSQEGTHYVKCSVCNATEAQKVAKKAHTWVEGTAVDGVTPITCSVCNATGIQFDGFTGDNASRLSSGKINYAGDFKWNVNMPKAGKVSLQMHIAYSNGNGDKKFGTGYTLKCGDTNGDITIEDVRYDSLLGAAHSTYDYIEFGQVVVPEGASQIVFHYANASVRLLSDKLVRLVYVA